MAKMQPGVRVNVKRGQVHKTNVAEWIALLQEGAGINDLTIPEAGIKFVEHTGFDESVRDTLLSFDNSDVLIGYLIAMNQREEIRAK